MGPLGKGLNQGLLIALRARSFDYVAKYTASAAETWARSKGATEAEIVAARRCLKDAPARPMQAAEWAAQ